MTVTISTARSTPSANGVANDVTQVYADFTTCLNNDTAIKAKLDNVMSGNIEDSGTLTLNSNYSGSSPSTAKLGVERGTVVNTYLQFEETGDRWEATNDGTYYYPLLHKGYAQGCLPSYATASTINVATGIWSDATNTTTIEITSPLTLDITSTGINKLDTGAEASNTWYYIWLCKGSSGSGAVISASNTSPTLPSNYNTYKRLLPYAVRNDGSSNFVKSYIVGAWPNSPKIMYYDFETGSGTYRVLNGGTTTTAFSSGAGGASVSLTSFVPPISSRKN